MDSYDLKWKKSAFKELKKIKKVIIPKIISAAQNLTSNPHPANSKNYLLLNIPIELELAIIE
jgi:hypothetical protein